ncbi:MAG: WecB/TagA/CpsF family glycosyltransferase [Bacteroidota bacterium]
MKPHRRFDILGVRVSDLTASECLALLDDGLQDDRPRTAFYANAHSLNLTFSVPGFKDTLNVADILYADGVGLDLAARHHGSNIRENLTGTDFLPKILRWASETGTSVYFLGGRSEVVSLAARQALREFASLQLLGYHHGFFRDTTAVLDEINAREPDILFVGLGSPLQETWVYENRWRLHAKLVITVGGFFDFYSRCTRRAPAWLRRIRLEWLFRLLRNPVRMSPRYLVGIPLFLWRVFSAGLNRPGATEPEQKPDYRDNISRIFVS